MLELRPLWQKWLDHHEAQREQTDEWIEFRWMLEELRVSLFAQVLKTSRPVSVKRLQKLLPK